MPKICTSPEFDVPEMVTETAFYQPYVKLDGHSLKEMVGYQLDDEPNLYIGNDC